MAEQKEVVVVTGCSTGLGRGIATALSKRPRTLVVATARKLATIMDLKESGVAALVLECDVCSEESLKLCMQKAAALGGGSIDGLVCNAGVSSGGPIAVQPVKDIMKVMDTNVFGVIRTVQAAVPYMEKPKNRGGRIVISGSVMAYLTTPFAGAYCASKACVNSVGETLRMELKPFGISVTNLHAAAFYSKLSENCDQNTSMDVIGKSKYPAELTEARNHLSQRHPKAITAEVAGEIVVRKAFGPGPAPASVGLAGGYMSAMIMGFIQKWLPACIADLVLSKMFKLNTLKVD